MFLCWMRGVFLLVYCLSLVVVIFRFCLIISWFSLLCWIFFLSCFLFICLIFVWKFWKVWWFFMVLSWVFWLISFCCLMLVFVMFIICYLVKRNIGGWEKILNIGCCCVKFGCVWIIGVCWELLFLVLVLFFVFNWFLGWVVIWFCWFFLKCGFGNLSGCLVLWRMFD